jgi:hypothetical protein
MHIKSADRLALPSVAQVLMTVGKALQLAQDVQLGDNFW